jgi:hypothetical protein
MRLAVVCTIVLLVASVLPAAEPPALKPPPEAIAAPAAPAYVVVAPPGSYYRVDRYAVWQNYGVDLQGRFVARVVEGPCGAYYYYNGAPYPWASTHPLYHMPHAGD